MIETTDTAAILARARSIIARERAGLEALEREIGEEVTRAISLIMMARGRLVVTGIGKSGHIGRKLAATFASTGTPSFFVHAGEAAHGDLGMITPEDVVLAISNSGASKELTAVTDYCHGQAIPVIAITMKPASRLGKAANVVLRMPEVEEVCPINLAPTTSAMMMLALGHVLAVILMEARGFGDIDFAQFHPGGRLGMQLTTVGRFLEEHAGTPPFVAPDAGIDQVIATFAETGMGCVAVVTPASSALEGLITEGDLRRAYAPDLFDKRAADIMTRAPLTVETGTLIRQTVDLMKARRIAHLVVVENGRALNILHMKDLMQHGYA
ncbi:MAG: KpsF/GutQ family sugar-phosphate isomerase [Rhodobiaceae bacterium]|nr:KpsF/GutQ family sugar-phosphate isomerase [Rhodobiaceae bacterium]MCC0055182.1 KpsF/GutQ family sugar-phosphate isomerase [Rhodobiaceae bacterium]